MPYAPKIASTAAKTRMDMTMTNTIKVVPQRSCMREHVLAFSGVSGKSFS